MKPGIHLGIPFADYLSGALSDLPLLNAGTAATLLEECPRAAWFQHNKLNPNAPRKATKEQDIGTVCHSLLLEGDISKAEIIDPADYRSRPTKDNPEGSIPSGWSNKAIKEARATAIALGKIPILKGDFSAITAMVESAQTFIKGSEIADLWPDSDREATLVWTEGRIALCARPDALSKDRLIVVDVKTTGGSANPEAWGRTQIEGHNELQAAIGCRGLRRLVPDLRDEPRYVWLVIEQQAPYLCSLAAPDPGAMALANEKLAEAMALWTQCTASGQWPGYPSRICWIEPPAWAMKRWEERQPYQPPELGGAFTDEQLAGGIPL